MPTSLDWCPIFWMHLRARWACVSMSFAGCERIVYGVRCISSTPKQGRSMICAQRCTLCRRSFCKIARRWVTTRERACVPYRPSVFVLYDLDHIQVKALSEELENPDNMHRWRKLQGSDPSTYEMVQKIQALQRRLISKTEVTPCAERHLSQR